MIWDPRVRKLDGESFEFTNTVQSFAPPEMLEFLAKQGLAFEPFRTARQPNSKAHNQQETPLLAKSIERHALAHK